MKKLLAVIVAVIAMAALALPEQVAEARGGGRGGGRGSRGGSMRRTNPRRGSNKDRDQAMFRERARNENRAGLLCDARRDAR